MKHYHPCEVSWRESFRFPPSNFSRSWELTLFPQGIKFECSFSFRSNCIWKSGSSKLEMANLMTKFAIVDSLFCRAVVFGWAIYGFNAAGWEVSSIGTSLYVQSLRMTFGMCAKSFHHSTNAPQNAEALMNEWTQKIKTFHRMTMFHSLIEGLRMVTMWAIVCVKRKIVQLKYRVSHERWNNRLTFVKCEMFSTMLDE